MQDKRGIYSPQGDPLERYRRQLAIDGWDREIQEKIQSAEVTVVGAGGLGSPVLLYLAAAGIGKIRIIDGDTVNLSNLNRQILYHESEIGMSKAKAAAGRINLLNPSIEVRAVSHGLDADNFHDHLADTDILVDCLDNYQTRFLLNRFVVKNSIPLIHAGVHGLSGQLTTVLPGESPCLECLFHGLSNSTEAEAEPAPDSKGTLPQGAVQAPETPALGAVTGILGSLQALEVLKLISGLGRTFSGRLLIFNGLEGNFEEIQISKNPNCPVCGAA